MNDFLTKPTSEDEYHTILNNFLLWLKRQPQMQKHMNKDKVSTLVFQLGYDLMQGDYGQKFLYPNKSGYIHEQESKYYWESVKPTKKKNGKTKANT